MSPKRKIRKSKIVYDVKAHKIAPDLAKLRSKASSAAYGPGKNGHRGEFEEKYSLQGTIAECIAHDIYKDTDMSLAPLFDLEPVVAPDAVLGETKVDFKGRDHQEVKHYHNQKLFVNCDSHDNEKKKVDAYVFFEYDESSCDENGVCTGYKYVVPSEYFDKKNSTIHNGPFQPAYCITLSVDNVEEVDGTKKDQ